VTHAWGKKQDGRGARRTVHVAAARYIPVLLRIAYTRQSAYDITPAYETSFTRADREIRLLSIAVTRATGCIVGLANAVYNAVIKYRTYVDVAYTV